METTQDKNNAALLLRLPDELKAALQRQATLNGRRITSEINIRLRQSLGQDKEPLVYPKAQATVHHIQANVGTTDLDQAMLQIFKAMPVEKQLALLSLFK